MENYARLFVWSLDDSEIAILQRIERGIERYKSEHQANISTIMELLNLKHFSHMKPSVWRTEQIERQLSWLKSWKQWSRAAKSILTRIINKHGGEYEMVHGKDWIKWKPLIDLKTRLEAVFQNIPDREDDMKEMVKLFGERK